MGRKNLLPIMMLAILASCSSNAQTDVNFTPTDGDEFSKYWYGGKAELTSYNLEQSRYGAVHKGHAVLIFVTEDFSNSKQVKLDNPKEAGKDAVKVLKLNFTKKFNTGIYPYSMMMSVFKPIDFAENPNALKVTTASQEWCGHTFLQLNLKEHAYHLSGYSYFETEGDVNRDIKKTLLEDEVWNIIRLNPEKLPIGDVTVIPATFISRLTRDALTNKKAKATLQPSDNEQFAGDSLLVYELNYSEPDRSLRIYFEKEFPYEIMGWEDTYKEMTTKATKRKSMQLDYWNKNLPADLIYRAQLGLD